MTNPERARGLIAVDLDGTLLGPTGSLSARNAAALRAAADDGWWVTIATGRPPHLVDDLVDQLAGVVTYVVGGNGSIVATFPASPDEQGELLHLASFDVPTAHAVIRALRAHDPLLGFALATDAGFGHEPGFAERMPAAVPDDPIDDVLTIGGTSVFKLLVFHREQSVEEIVRSLPPVVDAAVGDRTDRFRVSHMGADAAEIGPAVVDKRAGLEWLCDHLGVDRADVIAFGDEGNDLTMLAWAGTSYAMANAPADVRAIADHVAPHHADDGVAQVLEAR